MSSASKMTSHATILSSTVVFLWYFFDGCALEQEKIETRGPRREEKAFRIDLSDFTRKEFVAVLVAEAVQSDREGTKIVRIAEIV